MNEDIRYIAFWIASLLLIVGGSLVLSYFVQKQACYTKYEDYAPQFSVFGGCRIDWEGKTTPVENVGFRDFN
jgi:lipid-A-disaccharide synthase-like uncharacterized protein